MRCVPEQPSDDDSGSGRDLAGLRARIDDLDGMLVRIVAERLAVCREVAAVKEMSETAVIQPTRVRDVVTSRRKWAIDAGVDPDFVEQLFRVLLTETHRIEVAGHRPDRAPDKHAAGPGTSGIDTVASRVDHVVVAVEGLDAAVSSMVERFGFHEVPVTGQSKGVRAVAAGGVTVVLVGREASTAVAHYLDRHGGGVQHVAIEVLSARYAQQCLVAGGAPLLTDVVVDADGHEQFFAAHDPATGLQLGFISRTGHRVGLGAENVLALFESLDG